MSSSAASESKSPSLLELDKQYLGDIGYCLSEGRWRELAAQAIVTASSRGDHVAATHFIKQLTHGVYVGEESKRLEVIETVRSTAVMTPGLFHLLNQAERNINIKILEQQLRSGPHICLKQYTEPRSDLDIEKEYLGGILYKMAPCKKSMLVAQAIIKAISLDDVEAGKHFLNELTYGLDQGDDLDRLGILELLRLCRSISPDFACFLQKAEKTIKGRIVHRQLVANSYAHSKWGSSNG